MSERTGIGCEAASSKMAARVDQAALVWAAMGTDVGHFTDGKCDNCDRSTSWYVVRGNDGYGHVYVCEKCGRGYQGPRSYFWITE